MKTSLEIAAEARLEPVQKIAARMGIPEAFVENYGRYRAKIDLDVLQETPTRPSARYILVTAITPTPLGEGKTTTSIGLGMALSRLGHNSVVTLRQSSLGPVFGIKGGGAGGGYSQVVPLEDSLLHVTGDIHAVSQAHNLIAAMTDNAWYHKAIPDIDPERFVIRRVMDINDRFLRHITVGQGGPKHGTPRHTGFDITAASELMAILALVDGRSQMEALKDLRARIARMVVAFAADGRPITAEDVNAAGAATVVMREALKPTLMQTLENTPVLLHAGPFGNIAHGNCSILADRVALSFADYVVTEAGFAMDLGGEKFFDIKCRTSGLRPHAAVVVATVRALKSHTGRYKIVPGKPLPPELLEERPEDVIEGGANLVRHLEILRQFGVPAVVALNAFPEDRPSEIEAVRKIALEAGALEMAVTTGFAEGGRGAEGLAAAVVRAAEQPSSPRLLYAAEDSIRDKVQTLATKVYGAGSVHWSEKATRSLELIERAGFGNLPVCMAKTHLSVSHDPALKGAPSGFELPVRDVRLSAGAGFVIAYAADIMTMPGLGSDPAGAHIDIDAEGRTVGLF